MKKGIRYEKESLLTKFGFLFFLAQNIAWGFAIKSIFSFLTTSHKTRLAHVSLIWNFMTFALIFLIHFIKKKVENINRKFFWMNDPVWMIELNQEVQHHYGDQGHSLDHPQCSDKSQNLGFLRKSFFGFWGAPINFLTPKNLIWP